MPYNIVVGRNESDRKKFGDEGTVLLGRSYVKMGRTTSLSNYVFMDVVRSHIVYVVGKRGSGKCVHGDTLIQLDDGSQIPIKDLKNNNQNVCGLDPYLKVKSLEKDEFFEREVNKIIHLKLRSGREIKITPEHPLFTVKGWVPVDKLNIGGRIAVPRKVKIFGKYELPDHEIKLLSYLLAEGHTKKVVLFSNQDEKIVEDFKNALSDFDSTLSLVKEQEGCYRISDKNWKTEISPVRNIKGQFTKDTVFKKRSIRKLIEREELFNKLATEKYLSDNLMRLTRPKLQLFLNRLFSCDGSIYKINNNWEISYSSSSEKLIKQVQSLLTRFGIISRLRYKKVKYQDSYKDAFELVLNSFQVTRFVEMIGFFGKKEILAKQADKETILVQNNPNVDTIPKEVWDIFRPDNWAKAGAFMGYSNPKSLRSSINYAPSRQKLLQISIAECNYQMRMLAESDIFWDEIVSMDTLTGNFKVYDISVPSSHNFVANDIIIHNSYTMGVIAEGMIDLPQEIKKNLSVIMLDTMGIYWTMKYPNVKEEDLLEEWNLEPKGLDVTIFTPKGYFKKTKDAGIPTDFPFSIKPNELTAEDWILTFELDANNPVAILIQKTLNDFSDKGIKNYGLNDIIKAMEKDKDFDKATRIQAINRFRIASHWGVFDEKEGTPINVLVKGGQVTVLDVSAYATGEGGRGVRALVIGLIAKKLFIERMISRKAEEVEAINKGYSYFQVEEEVKENKEPMVWLIIDEAHNFLPKTGKAASTDALVTILREGRQPGISLILATQQPGKIHSDVMTQSDLLISHRITAKPDADALNSMTQSYSSAAITDYLGNLPSEKGAALIVDDNSERIFPIRVRPKFSWHGGEAPTAIKVKRKLKLGLD